MKMLKISAALVFGLAVLLIGATGVDLTHSRSGFGMIAMALAGVLAVVSGPAGGSLSSRPVLVSGTILGAGYFIWRALSGGPVGVATADVGLVAILLGSYLVCLTGGEPVLKVVVVCLGATSLANAGMVAYQLASDSQVFLWREPYGDKPAATGLFGHYNYLAAYLNASVFLFFALLFYVRNWWGRSLCLLIVLSSIACVLASGSRGGWFGFVAGFAILVGVGLVSLKARRHPGFGAVAIVSLVALVGVVVTAVPLVQEQTNRRTGAGEKAGTEEKADAEINDGGRMYFQELAFEMFQDAPVTGNGPRSFAYLALEYWDPEEHSNWNANPVFAHNEFMQVLADYGLAGMVFVVLILFGHGVSGVIAIILEQGSRPALLAPLKVGALGGLAAMGTQSFFSFIVHIPACAMVLGLLLAFLALTGSMRNRNTSGKMNPVVLVTLLLTTGALGYLGTRLSKSYLLFEEGKTALENASGQDETMKALGQLKDAAEAGYNPEILESSGRYAMAMSSKARDAGDNDAREEFASIAMDHLRGVQALNPNSSVALVMIPHVHDMLGEFEEANSGYEQAMERLGVREPYLKPHLYAARSRYGQGLMSMDRDKSTEALVNLRKARELIVKRTEILNAWRERPADKDFRLEIEARIALLEGEILYREGDRVWKEARPRKPELAYALMLAASERYQAGEEIINQKDGSKWAAQWKQLQKNLELLKLVGTKPVNLTREQISEVINREAGLDPGATKR